MNWNLDAPLGVYRNHALSPKVRMAALQRTIFARWVRPESGYGKGKGDTVTITRVEQLVRAARISESGGIPVASLPISTKSVTVAMWGLMLEMTELHEHLNHFNLRNTYQRALRDNMQLTFDGAVCEAMKATVVKVIPTAADAAVFDTDGTPSTTADANVTVDTIRKCKDNLVTRKVPPFSNGRYVAVLTTKAARGVKNDTASKDWLAPTSAAMFARGMFPGGEGRIPGGTTPLAEYLGTIENVDLYEINMDDSTLLSNSKGSGGILGEGLVFGDDAAFLAQVMAPELRAGLPTQLGTKREVGWVGTFETGLVWDSATQTRVIHITSQ